jgi:hypothetical protein
MLPAARAVTPVAPFIPVMTIIAMRATVVAWRWAVIPRTIINRGWRHYDLLVVHRWRRCLIVDRLWCIDRLRFHIDCPGLVG